MTTEKELKKLKKQVNDLYLRVNVDGTYHFAYMQRSRFTDTLVEVGTQSPVKVADKAAYMKIIERAEGLDRFGSSHRFNSEIYRYVLNTSADRLEDLTHSFYSECDPGKVVRGSSLVKLEKQLQVSDKLDAIKIARTHSRALADSVRSIYSHRAPVSTEPTTTPSVDNDDCM